MDDPEQAIAYANGNFEESHAFLVHSGLAILPPNRTFSRILDIGSGSGDNSLRWKNIFPKSNFTYLEASKPMMELHQSLIKSPELDKDRWFLGRLEEFFPEECYDLVVSNSVLHHCWEPMQFWSCLQRSVEPGSWVVITDLVRPISVSKANFIVDCYAKEEPEILKRDFFRSLGASFTVPEVESMLNVIRLSKSLKCKMISDRHWMVFGEI